MNLFTSGLALTGLVSLPLAIQSQDGSATNTQAAAAVNTAAAHTTTSAPVRLRSVARPKAGRDAFARFQPRAEATDDDPILTLKRRTAEASQAAASAHEKFELQAEIAALQAEIAALSGKAAALESAEAVLDALETKELAEKAKQEITKVTGLKVHPISAATAKQPKLITWSGADGQTGYGLYDAEDDKVVYFDDEHGAQIKLEGFTASEGDAAEWQVHSGGHGEANSWSWLGGDASKDLSSWLEGEEHGAWLTDLEDQIAVLETGDGGVWKVLTENVHPDGKINLIVQGEQGQPIEVSGKALVDLSAESEFGEAIRIIESIQADKDGHFDVTIATTEDGKVIQKHIKRYTNNQKQPVQGKALYKAYTTGGGEQVNGDARVILADTYKALAQGMEDHADARVLYTRALGDSVKSKGQNPFVNIVEGHRKSEDDDLRSLLEAMAADLTEVRHEVKAIRALLEGGAPLGQAPRAASLFGEVAVAPPAPHQPDRGLFSGTASLPKAPPVPGALAQPDFPKSIEKPAPLAETPVIGSLFEFRPKAEAPKVPQNN